MPNTNIYLSVKTLKKRIINIENTADLISKTDSEKALFAEMAKRGVDKIITLDVE